MSTFDVASRQTLARAYPESPQPLRHNLTSHPLLELEALAALAGRLPDGCVDYNLGDQPLGIEAKPPRPPVSIGEAIRNVAQTNTWAVLAKVQQDPVYGAFIDELIDELRGVIEPATGPVLMPLGYIFVTSPGGVVPFHFDPEHNILMQVRGSKVFTCFPPGDPALASDLAHEEFHANGTYTLGWDEAHLAKGTPYELNPGDALYVPVKAPHFVRNGAEPSISLSITWRSEWSFAEADARAFNRVLRRYGLSPRAPGRWPQRNRGKALAWRIIRKIGRSS
jgi:hypothetical protein